MRKPSARVTERALVRCIERAQRDGFVIVFNAKTVDGTAQHPGGVCAMGAYERLRHPPRLTLPSGSYDLSRAWDAIEAGFDGNTTAADEAGRPLPRKWLSVGERLRERFEPIDAQDAERMLGTGDPS